MIDWLDANGGRRDGFDVVMEGETPVDDPMAAARAVRPWGLAGCTWWLETRWEASANTSERAAEVRRRIIAGPPVG